MRVKSLFCAIFAIVFGVFSSANIASAADRVLSLEAAEILEASTNVEASEPVIGEDNQLSSTVTFHAVGDVVKYQLTFKNLSSDDIVIHNLTNDNSSPFVSYEYDVPSDQTVVGGASLVSLLQLSTLPAKQTLAVARYS